MNLTPRQIQRLNAAPVGRLATAALDAAPHIIPVCFALANPAAGARIYSVLDQKPKRAPLTRLRPRPQHPRQPPSRPPHRPLQRRLAAALVSAPQRPGPTTDRPRRPGASNRYPSPPTKIPPIPNHGHNRQPGNQTDRRPNSKLGRRPLATTAPSPLLPSPTAKPAPIPLIGA